MSKQKFVLVISYDLFNSRADFFQAVKDFEASDIEMNFVDKAEQIINTEYVRIRFMSRRQSLEGYHCDEIFGYRDKYIEERLKDPKKPRFSGSLVEYIKKIDENAKSDAFLLSELARL